MHAIKGGNIGGGTRSPKRAPSLPVPSLLVKRDRLLRELCGQDWEPRVSVICAPKGFGKTALMLQYVSEVRGDPSRGMARLMDAGDMDGEQFGKALQKLDEELEPKMRPLVAIDNLPVLNPETLEHAVETIRAMRARGFEFLISCDPANRPFVNLMGDSNKIGAQTLKVHPREYSEWARVFSIDSTLDVYELTQGVPALVVALQSITGQTGGTDSLDKGILDLYRSILDSLRRDRDPLYRLACLFIFMGRGNIIDLERCGVRVRPETLSRIARDYPVFGFDSDTRGFKCMGTARGVLDRLRKETAVRRPAFVQKAVRMLMQARRVDDAVALAGLVLDTEGALEVIERFPVQFATSGNAVFVSGIISRLSGEAASTISVNVVLSIYLSGLVTGEYRLARAMASELCRRASEIERLVDPGAWTTACALSEVWSSCSGTALPKLSDNFVQGHETDEARLLRVHLRAYRELVGGDGNPGQVDYSDLEKKSRDVSIDIPRLLLECDRILDDALHGEAGDPVACDKRLQDIAEALSRRHLVPIAARVRMVAATCRLVAGLPLVDERAFTDAGTTAVRESDFATQLFCMLAEGWQSLDTGQLVNARFRAQQILKLSDESQTFLRSWGVLLERTAFVLNTSRLMVCEEAELLDLSQESCSPAEAWAVALHLAAARYDSELSAWYSIHKSEILDSRFYPLARLAMAAVGERADAIRRLLPYRIAPKYLLGAEPGEDIEPMVRVAADTDFTMLGQVSVGLFGGFRVERNGHTLTDEIWRRKKTSVLAARLTLALGSFVSRRVITEEMWPHVEYGRARENLYVTLSSLRSAFGQRASGPQYVLTQGEGIALNGEYVASDTNHFDMLAREILLKRTGVSGRQIIESCLKVEQLYLGPLYVPESGDPAFFLRMRRAYLSKFIDCMLRGIDVAIEIDDIRSASWLVEAALRQAPLREDVVRHAMKVYDMSGRRREVVELYNSHLHYLEQELRTVPEEETRLAYEAIVNKSKMSILV